VANQLAPRMERRGGGGVNRLLGIIEPAMTVGSAIAAEVPALAVGLGSLNTVEDRQRPFSEAVSAADEVRDMLTYNPRSMEGQAGMQSLINSVSQIADTVGLDKAFQVLNEEIIPRVQNTLGEDAARELGSMAMMIPAVRRVTKVVQPSADIPEATENVFIAAEAPELGGGKALDYEIGKDASSLKYQFYDKDTGLLDTEMPSFRKEKEAEDFLNLYQTQVNPDKNLMFLQNTSQEALESFDEIGGMPMPSLAVTKEDIPFQGFGEITLVGKPESFDPRASRTNEMFSADAYTVRAPRPMQLAKKNADDIFEKKYGTSKELNEIDIYADDIRQNLSEQSYKSGATSYQYNRIKEFFENPRIAKKLFALDQGYDKNKLPKQNDSVEVKKQKEIELNNFISKKQYEPTGTNVFLDEFPELGNVSLQNNLLEPWKEKQLSDLLEPEKVFVTNPDRDYVTGRAIIKPYTAENVTKFMRKSSGPNQEAGFGQSGIGAQRAATAEPIKSLKQARERKDQLQTKDALEELKETQFEAFDAITNDLKKYYEFDSDNFRFLDEVGDLIKISERKGLDAAFREVGFKDVPESLKDAINEYKDSLRSAPTQYFESKPKRVVDLSEFGGAIVPKGSEPQIRKILEKYGITRLKTYETDVERTAARKAFQDLMFSIGLPATVAGSIIYGEEDQSV